MTYDVIITDQALLDMKTTYTHIALVLMEPVLAEEQYTRLENAAYSLAHMPERFRRYEKEPWRSRNLRVVPIDNYLMFYIADHKRRAVTILRILYGKRDIEKELNDMEKKGG